jgi:ubiquinol-cytochrome c reductase cytochrome c subunit
MSRTKFSGAMFGALALLTAESGTGEDGNAARGRELYFSVGCYACHGTEGQGSILTGPRIAPEPVPLPVFRSFVRTPPSIMPPYSAAVLSDSDVANIHAYLATIPQPPDVDDVLGTDR